MPHPMLAPTARFVLDAACPVCSGGPPMRATAAEVDLHRSLDPDTPCGSVRCGRHCRGLIVLTAGSYQRARPESVARKRVRR